jgi:hypothetical protein
MYGLGTMGKTYSNLIRFLLLLVTVILLANKTSIAQVPDSTKVKVVSEIFSDTDEDGRFDFLGKRVTVGGRATVGTSSSILLRTSNLLIAVNPIIIH